MRWPATLRFPLLLEAERHRLQTFDYIVVGAGSAGCPLAARLAEGGASVLLLEAGGWDWDPWIHIPIGIGRLFNDSSLNWRFWSEPEDGLNGRKIYQPRGKVLGGTSAINGMVYIRGRPEDYDGWRALGCEGWGWDDVLPYFRKSEDQQRGADAWHGVGGPLTISDQSPWELGDRFLAAAQQAGLPANPDFNGPAQEGVGYYQRNTRHNRRWSAARAYLAGIGGRRKLTVKPRALVRRVLLEAGRASGVEVDVAGAKCIFRARKEIVLSAGCYNTPKLLMLSGIGPADHLESCGIPVLLDAPEVGENLQDHFWTKLSFRCTKPITINEFAHSPVRKALAGLQYVLTRSGPLASTGVTAGGFARSGPDVSRPDLQFNFLGWSVTQPDTTRVNPDRFPGFSIIIVDLHPNHRGRVRLRSTDPAEAPEIRFNFITEAFDPKPLISGIRMLRNIVSQPAIAGYVAGELEPGDSVQSDDQLFDYLRQKAMSNQHAVGTCRMGADTQSVVDPQLRVRGVEGLRVADISIMPRIVSGNTNAPAIMIGEKAADLILGC